jgi:hypothetical protein
MSHEEEMEISASFGIRAVNLDPEHVTRVLGLSASRSFARGDEYLTKVSKTDEEVRRHTFGVWQFSSQGQVESLYIQDHIDFLIRELAPVRSVVESMVEDSSNYIDIRLWVESSAPVNSFSIKAEALALLAPICHDLNVSVIGGDPEE